MNQQDLTYPTVASTPGQPLELTFPAHAEWVSVVRLATAGVAQRLGFSFEDIEDIKLAVAEACNNAILHAAPKAADNSVQVQWLPCAKHLEIAITDNGMLAPHQLPLYQPREAPLVPDLSESGMGLLLIEALMDKVEQSVNASGHTVLRMIKLFTTEMHIPANIAP